MLLDIREKSKQISSPSIAADIFRNILLFENEVDQDKEHFWAIGLNSKNIILYVELVALGILNNTLVHPREVFRMAILKAAANIIVGHNHPSGILEISSEDRIITERLRHAGEILGIKLLDHIVIGNNNPDYACLDNGLWSIKKGRAHENLEHLQNGFKNKNDILEKAIKSDKRIQNTRREMKKVFNELLSAESVR